MAVTFMIPGYLRSFTDGHGRVQVQDPIDSVGAALERLWTIYPGVRDRVVTEQGEVRPHVNVFVGNESIRFTGGLETRLAHGAEIWIVPAVSGG